MTVKEYHKNNKNNLNHDCLYEFMVKKISLEKCIPLLPVGYSKEDFKTAYNRDIHLNNIPLKKWDIQVAYGNTGSMNPNFSLKPEIKALFKSIGITSLSLSECVCLLKATARLYINS